MKYLLIFLFTTQLWAECGGSGRCLTAPIVYWHDFYYIDTFPTAASGTMPFLRCIDLNLTNIGPLSHVDVSVTALSEWNVTSALGTVSFPMTLIDQQTSGTVSVPVSGTATVSDTSIAVSDFKRLTYCAQYVATQANDPYGVPIDIHLIGALKFVIHVQEDRGAMLASFYSHMETAFTNAAGSGYNGTAYESSLSSQRNSIQMPMINGGRPF